MRTSYFTWPTLIRLVFTIVALSTVYGFLAPKDALKTEILGGSILLAVAEFSLILQKLYENRNRVSNILKGIVLSLFGKPLRVSMSYQLEIFINDKYLLVPNSHTSHLQFPGGKYKYQNSALNFLKRVSFAPEKFLNKRTVGRKDLAFRISPRKLHQFIDWFKCSNDRERGINRELYEEVLKDSYHQETWRKLLGQNSFSFECTVETPIHQGVKPIIDHGTERYIFEYLSYDIFSLSQGTADDDVISIFTNKLVADGTAYWASSEEINNGETTDNDGNKVKIHKHARYVINQAFDNQYESWEIDRLSGWKRFWQVISRF